MCIESSRFFINLGRSSRLSRWISLTNEKKKIEAQILFPFCPRRDFEKFSQFRPNHREAHRSRHALIVCSQIPFPSIVLEGVRWETRPPFVWVDPVDRLPRSKFREGEREKEMMMMITIDRSMVIERDKVSQPPLFLPYLSFFPPFLFLPLPSLFVLRRLFGDLRINWRSIHSSKGGGSYRSRDEIP